MALAELLDQMMAKMYEAKEEAEKFEIKGNNAAGTRTRKAMQEIKHIATDVRNTVTEIKNERKGV